MKGVSPETVLNFAYGSNMLLARIRERVPSARPLGVAVLRGHRLFWHKAGRDGSGKCDVVESNDADTAVFGVLYEIARAEKHFLDAAEGLGAGYDEKRVQLERETSLLAASLYQATDIEPSWRPYSWYKALVVAGAREHGLPPHYVASLEGVAAIDDSDRTRHARHVALAQAGRDRARHAGR
ncbi:MAG: gamma-glutamylcyclotransferase [Candidatus Accumulibacter sp.]|nr:gamma-glutamylcyclotransferase [Accumulibacter sp.]MCB1965363.1 gamma-glutamylcyclotransferase [Accumulibacter sp.]